MAEIPNEHKILDPQARPTPQLRRRRGSKSLANLPQIENNEVQISQSQVELEETKPEKERGYQIRKFHRSYSQILKEIEELKPQKSAQFVNRQKQTYLEMKANKSQKQRVDELYNKLSQKYKLEKVSKEELFQKAITPFKELKTFVDLKDKIQEMNIIENKDFKKNLEILKIRDKVTQLNEELSRKSGIEDEEGVQQLTFKENMLNSIKQNYEASQVKRQRQVFNKKLTSYLSNDTQIDNVDENSTEWSKLPAPFHGYLQSFIIKQKKSNAMKKREEGIKKNIVESEKEREFRQKIIESQYDMNGQTDQKFPQNQYYENFKRKTDQIILDAKKQVTRQFRKSFNLGHSNTVILNSSKVGGGPLSPITKGIKHSNTVSNDNFFLTENTNTNSNNNMLNKPVIPLSKIQSQSNSSQASLMSSLQVSPRSQRPPVIQQQMPEIKSKFIAFKKNARSSTIDDFKSTAPPPISEIKSQLYSSRTHFLKLSNPISQQLFQKQDKDSSASIISKPQNNIERISRQVSKIISSYKDDVQKIMDERERKELDGLNNSSILNMSQQMKQYLRNERSDNSILNIQNNSFRSNSHNTYFRQKSDQILMVQRGAMKKFLTQIQQAEDIYQLEKSDINHDLLVIQNELEKHMQEMNEMNNFNWEGLTKNELADQVVNHYLFSKLRQRRIKSQQEFLRQSKITRTNY